MVISGILTFLYYYIFIVPFITPFSYNDNFIRMCCMIFTYITIANGYLNLYNKKTFFIIQFLCLMLFHHIIKRPINLFYPSKSSFFELIFVFLISYLIVRLYDNIRGLRIYSLRERIMKLLEITVIIIVIILYEIYIKS